MKNKSLYTGYTGKFLYTRVRNTKKYKGINNNHNLFYFSLFLYTRYGNLLAQPVYLYTSCTGKSEVLI